MSPDESGSEGLICQLHSGVWAETWRWPDIPTPTERFPLRDAYWNGASNQSVRSRSIFDASPHPGKKEWRWALRFALD
jgi:hypothetical protein